jgi:hypothetical protein
MHLLIGRRRLSSPETVKASDRFFGSTNSQQAMQRTAFDEQAPDQLVRIRLDVEDTPETGKLFVV